MKVRTKSLGLAAAFSAAVLLLAAVAAPGSAAPDKMAPEEVAAKHLESIGTAQAREAIKNRIIQGQVTATVRIGGSGQSKGGAVMASEGTKSLMGLVFGPQQYSNEKVGYDGKRLTLGETAPGVRTNLGGFLMTHDIVFREGLIGGVLSSAWPFYDLAARGPKLRYAGTKKVGGREAHVLRYESRKGGNLEIKLYFDTENFRHLRTEYEQRIQPPPVEDPGEAARQKETHLKLVEEFSDFKAERGLTLPHTYKIQLSFDRMLQPVLQDWVITLTQFNFNQKITEDQFNVAGT